MNIIAYEQMHYFYLSFQRSPFGENEPSGTLKGHVYDVKRTSLVGATIVIAFSSLTPRQGNGFRCRVRGVENDTL